MAKSSCGNCGACDKCKPKSNPTAGTTAKPFKDVARPIHIREKNRKTRQPRRMRWWD